MGGHVDAEQQALDLGLKFVFNTESQRRTIYSKNVMEADENIPVATPAR